MFILAVLSTTVRELLRSSFRIMFLMSDALILPKIRTTVYLSRRGNITSFWSSESMSDPEFYIGMLHLVGEIPRIISE